jgi:hypothetical protein
VLNSGTEASNRQNTASPKYNDDISLLISRYLILCVLLSSCGYRYDMALHNRAPHYPALHNRALHNRAL